MESVTMGSLSANSEETMSMRLKTELDTLEALTTLIVCAPRGVERDGATNYVNCAEQVIAVVPGHYERIHGRGPGMVGGPVGGNQLE